MDADWYEDPLGRFDGRYFDGEHWTAEVSAGGVLQTDPEFLAPEPEPAPAVAPVVTRGPRRASTMAESPARTVAVLDPSVVAAPPSDGDAGARSAGRRWLAMALLAAIAAVLVFALTRGSDEPQLDAVDQDRVEDLESGGLLPPDDVDAAQPLDAAAPASPADIGAEFDAGDAVQVGDVVVANGARVLAELADWHRLDAGDRGIILGDDAGCWFGELVDAALQVIPCGPVDGDSPDSYEFDLVPVAFDQVDGRQVARVDTEAVTVDTVLANPVMLIAAADGTPPPAGLG